MVLTRQTGTITNLDGSKAVSISTGLSSIKHFVVYRTTMDSTGLLIGNYNSNVGTHYTYCNSYGDYTKFINQGSNSATVSGGTITLPGNYDSNTYALATGKSYSWIAYGDK